ncbi:asparagine synthase (glutamine-hydrolyzing), partial [Candidatus Uhrbacteria bacterium]|nr:asparagine synthase (glutamine-hydrolyzing) [Candidatus Uhrbacteria bacterium]MBD3284244.1 asparagine synthase (glutamine-hydrolyzing) [Candidatus Uhrbacteria bacterium]
RGPDGEGIWIHPGVGLGHRRLAIIELTDLGAQPMRTKDGKYTITYNGEVYNYKSLRAELEQKGSVFYSESDTEVVLEAYRHFGPDCTARLRGMFAFAIWDEERQSCFIARDRIGKKPLYYRTLSDGTIAFASELNPLRALESVSVDRCAIRLFIGLQYVPAPKTGFKEISCLPAGHRGWIRNGEVRVEAYETWERHPSQEMLDVSQDLLQLLSESVRIRLQADVSVGAFLSGGIDSAACVAIAQQYMDRPIHTFTMGFPYIKMDERHEARETANYFNTDHHEFEAKPESLLAMTEQLIEQYGGPYADSSALPVMLLAREVAKEIKVVLVGDGGDELFGGYRRYRAFCRALALASIPGSRLLGASMLKRIGKFMHDPRFTRMSETVKATAGDANAGYAELFTGSYFSSKYAPKYFDPAFMQGERGCDPVSFIRTRMGSAGHPMQRALYFDLTSYLADDLNVKMDRATMTYGLEARAPFLDQELMSYVLRLPLNRRMNCDKPKMALKQALKGLVPTEIMNRKKRGFQVPLAEWFRGSLKQHWMDRCLDPSSPLRAYIQPEKVKVLFEENVRGVDHGNRLWMLWALAAWLERVNSNA